MHRDAAAVGMPDEMDLPVGAIDQRKGSSRFVGSREGVATGPGRRIATAVMLGCGEREIFAERCLEPTPLRGARAGAVQRDHQLWLRSRR